MDRSANREMGIRTDWIIKALCFYNAIAFLVSTRLVVLGLHANFTKGISTPWLELLVYSGILLLLAFSTVGLWFKKEWAYLVQVILYLLQLLVLNYPLKFAFYLGLQYVITFTFTKTGGAIGINLVPLVFLIFLVAVKKEFLIRRS